MLIKEEEYSVSQESANSPSYKASQQDFYRSFNTKISTDTIEQYTSSKYSNLKISYILITFLNTIIGLFVLFTHGKFLKKHIILAHFYIVSYTFLWPISILIGLIVTGMIVLIRKIIKNRVKDENNFIFSRLPEEYDAMSYYNFVMIIFLFVLIALYVLSLPLSIYLLYLLVNHNIFYFQYKNYIPLFLFVIVNSMKSIAIFIFSIIMYYREKFKPYKVQLDEEFIKQIEEEIEQANKFSGIIAPSSDLIKMNYMFNRQYAMNTIENNWNPSLVELNQTLNSNKNRFINKNSKDCLSPIELGLRDSQKSIRKNQTIATDNPLQITIPAEDPFKTAEKKMDYNKLIENKKTNIKKFIREKTLNLDEESSRKKNISKLKSLFNTQNTFDLDFKSKSPTVMKNHPKILFDREVEEFKLEEVQVEPADKSITQAGRCRSRKTNESPLISPSRAHDDINIHLGSSKIFSYKRNAPETSINVITEFRLN